MKYYLNGKHVKSAPKKYEVLTDFFSFITDLSKKRLSVEERDALNVALFWHNIKDDMRSTREGQLALRMIEDERPVKAVRVSLRDKKHYFVAITQGRKEIKVDANFYNAFPVKENIFRNY